MSVFTEENFLSYTVTDVSVNDETMNSVAKVLDNQEQEMEEQLVNDLLPLDKSLLVPSTLTYTPSTQHLQVRSTETRIDNVTPEYNEAKIVAPEEILLFLKCIDCAIKNRRSKA